MDTVTASQDRRLGVSVEQSRTMDTSKDRLWHKWLRFCLFIQNIDPYALFKPPAPPAREPLPTMAGAAAVKRTNLGVLLELPAGCPPPADNHHHHHLMGPQRHRRRHLDSIYQSEELRLARTSRERCPSTVTRFIRWFAVYICAKMTLVYIAQYTLLMYQYRPKAAGSSLLSLGAAKTLAQLVGNPLYPLKDTALLVYIGPVFYLAAFIILLPRHYSRRPMDNAALRFLLSPRHELKRADACTRSKLARLRASFDNYRRQQARHLQFGRQASATMSAPPTDAVSARAESAQFAGDDDDHRQQQQLIKAMQCREEHFCQKLHHYLQECESNPAELRSLRPENFTPAYFVKISTQIHSAVYGSIWLYSICNIVLSLAFWWPLYQDRCKNKQSQGSCSIGQLYTLPEIVLNCETFVTMTLNTLISSLNMSLTSLITTNQLDLIESAKSELIECRSLLAVKNWHRYLQQSKQVDYTATAAANNKTTTSGRLGSFHSGMVTLNFEDELNKQLLKSLIKLSNYDDELEKNSRCMSMEVLHPIYYALGTIFLFITNGRLRVLETNFTRNFIMIVSWLNVNIIAISCAHMYSRVLEFKRILWSILAVGLEAHQDCYFDCWPARRLWWPGQRRRGLKCCTLVIDMWTRYIRSSFENLERHCPHPFYVEFNYRGVIEANFFAIFIYTFTSHQ
jgi:hypothetical protein